MLKYKVKLHYCTLGSINISIIIIIMEVTLEMTLKSHCICTQMNKIATMIPCSLQRHYNNNVIIIYCDNSIIINN